MGGRSTRDVAVAPGAVASVVLVAVAAERVGYEGDLVGDLVAGSALGVAGAVLLLGRRRAVGGRIEPTPDPRAVRAWLP